MTTPTPEQTKEAIEHLRKSTWAQLCFDCVPALDTLIAALKAEQERLDWFFEICHDYDTVDRVFRANNRRAVIDSLRHQTKP